MASISPTNTTTNIQIILDRLSICFNEPNKDNVKGTCGLILSDKYTKEISGMKVTANARYHVSARIPMPITYDAVEKHPVYFEAGPKMPGYPSYRLDFNPAKLTSDGIDELKCLLDSIMDPTPEEFFGKGRVTRVDIAADLNGLGLNDLIVLASRKQKHGVYSNRYGEPETVYLGTPRSARVVAYTRPTKASGVAIRLECRLKPRCPGEDIASLPNPFSKVTLYSVKALTGLGLPPQMLADSIRLRGVKPAIQGLDPKKQKMILAALDPSKSILPDASALWAGWPMALILAGLGKELGAPLPFNTKQAA
jgi:hypothetical protein